MGRDVARWDGLLSSSWQTKSELIPVKLKQEKRLSVSSMKEVLIFFFSVASCAALPYVRFQSLLSTGCLSAVLKRCVSISSAVTDTWREGQMHFSAKQGLPSAVGYLKHFNTTQAVAAVTIRSSYCRGFAHLVFTMSSSLSALVSFQRWSLELV